MEPNNQPNNQPYTSNQSPSQAPNQPTSQPKNPAPQQATTVNKRNILITGIIIVGIIVLVIAMPKRKVVAPEQATTPTADTTTGATPGATTGATTPATSPSTPSSTPPATSLSYKEALAKYQNSIIRITDACSANPVMEGFVMVKGQVVMIANDSVTKSHTVVINGTAYSIGLQHYKTFTLPVAGTIASVCDPKTGTTTVTLTPQQ